MMRYCPTMLLVLVISASTPAAEQHVTLSPIEIQYEPANQFPSPSGRLYDIETVGSGVDLLSAGGSLYIMKTKGTARRIWAPEKSQSNTVRISFDGRYVWAVSSTVQGEFHLLVVDPESEKVHEVTASDGIPQLPASKSKRPPYPTLFVVGISPGKACIAGSFNGRTWVGLASFTAGNAFSIKIIHDINTKVETSYVVKLHPAAGKGTAKALIGRKGDVPLIVDADKASVSPLKTTPPFPSARPPAALCSAENGLFYFASLDVALVKSAVHQLTVADSRVERTQGVVTREDPSSAGIVPLFHNNLLNLAVNTRASNAGTFDPKAERIAEWWQFDPKTQQTRMIAKGLPPLQHLTKSSHYGIVALGGDHRNAVNTRQFAVDLKDPGSFSGAPISQAPKGDTPRWAIAIKAGTWIGEAFLLPESKLVLVHNTSEFPHVYDAETGGAKSAHFKNTPSRVDRILPLGGDRFATWNFASSHLDVWDARTGTSQSKIAIPAMPAGDPKAKYLTLKPSPDGKYLAAALYHDGLELTTAPFRLIQTATGKVILSLQWQNGSVHFTADSSRVLVADGGGRFQWYKLPSGEAAEGWDFRNPIDAKTHIVTGVSHDGKVICYYGRGSSKTDFGAYLLEGSTGKVLREFKTEHRPETLSAITSDGRYVALLRKVRGGEQLTYDIFPVVGPAIASVNAQLIKLPLPAYIFSPDGKTLVVYDYTNGKLSRFDVPLK